MHVAGPLAVRGSPEQGVSSVDREGGGLKAGRPARPDQVLEQNVARVGRPRGGPTFPPVVTEGLTSF